MIFLGIYMVYSLLLLLGTLLFRSKIQVQRENGQGKHFALIIAFRNEEKQLPALLNSLEQLQLKAHYLEQILFVNDHSDDNSVITIENFSQQTDLPIELFHLSEGQLGKKSAVDLAIEKANSSLIYSIDADCIIDEASISAMLNTMDEDKQLVTGQVCFNGAGWFTDILNVELAPVIGMTALSIHAKQAGMANAANMLFRKQAYVETKASRNDFSIPSGDDVYLLEAVKEKYGAEAIGFCKGSVVKTSPPQSFKQFINQRIRWASKWNKSKSKQNMVMGLLVLLFHCMHLTLMVKLCINLDFKTVAQLFTIKALGEFVFIGTILASQRKRISLTAFFFCSIFYSFYVLVIGICSNFMSYSWKGREYGRIK